MASLRQVESNRRNALMSTGPKTEAGKCRARSNAVRHGLTAETAIDILEDPEDYKAFEMSVTSDFDAGTAVERELVLRLAGLLWRLRRATAIETGLLEMQGTTGEKRKGQGGQAQISPLDATLPTIESGEAVDHGPNARIKPEIANYFLRLAGLDNGAFERLNRYETALWRQVGQVLFTLDWMRHRDHPL